MPYFNNTEVRIPVATVARKPELREVGSKGQVRAELLVAVDRGYGRDSGTDWVQVVCWNGEAKNVTRYLDKGARVGVEGHLRGDFYENKEGKRVRSLEVVADRVRFLSRPRVTSEEELPARQVQGRG